METQEKKQLTKEEIEERRQKNITRYNNAYNEAANEILKGGDEKVKNVEAGAEQAILYTFHFMKDANAKEDSNGKKIIFGENVRLLDILTKGRGRFLSILNNHFNKDGETKYHSGFYKKNRNDDSGLSDWNIFVSWRPRQTRVQNDKSFKKTYSTSNEGKKTYVKKGSFIQTNKTFFKKNPKQFSNSKPKNPISKPDTNPNSWANRVKNGPPKKNEEVATSSS
jgi:hypothetical protein